MSLRGEDGRVSNGKGVAVWVYSSVAAAVLFVGLVVQTIRVRTLKKECKACEERVENLVRVLENDA